MLSPEESLDNGFSLISDIQYLHCLLSASNLWLYKGWTFAVSQFYSAYLYVLLVYSPSVIIPVHANSRQVESKEPIANYESSLTVQHDGGSQLYVCCTLNIACRSASVGQKLGWQQKPTGVWKTQSDSIWTGEVPGFRPLSLVHMDTALQYMFTGLHTRVADMSDHDMQLISRTFNMGGLSVSREKVYDCVLCMKLKYSCLAIYF